MFQTWQSYACEYRPDRGPRVATPMKRSAIVSHIVGLFVSHVEVAVGANVHDHDHRNHIPSSAMCQFDFEGNLSFVATTNQNLTTSS